MTREERKKRDKLVINDSLVHSIPPQEISRIRHISLSTVYSILNGNGIKWRKGRKGRKKKVVIKEPTWNTEELKLLYQVIDMSASELAYYYQVSIRWMEKVLQTRGIKKIIT